MTIITTLIALENRADEYRECGYFVGPVTPTARGFSIEFGDPIVAAEYTDALPAKSFRLYNHKAGRTTVHVSS